MAGSDGRSRQGDPERPDDPRGRGGSPDGDSDEALALAWRNVFGGGGTRPAAALSTRAIVAAALEANRAELEAARGHGWRSPSFGLARALRGAPGFVGLAPDTAADLVERAFGEMRPDLEPAEAWAVLVGETDSAGRDRDAQADFLDCWRRGLGEGLGGAFAAATADPRTAKPEWLGRDFAAPRRAKVRLLALVAVHLGSGPDGRPRRFALPTEALAERLGSDPATVAAWRRELVERGLLRQVSPAARPTAGKPGRAAEFVTAGALATAGITLAGPNSPLPDLQSPDSQTFNPRSSAESG